MHAYLAAEGAESEIVEKAALARLTSVGDALGCSGLRPLVKEHNSRTVDDVRLHIGDVQHLLNLRHADHVVVRRAPNLNNVVVLVVGMGASGADAIAHAVQAEEITLASVEHPMNRAIEEEIGLEHWLQPGRPLRRLFHLGVVFLLLLLLFLLVHELYCPSLHRNFHNDDL
jgi:hypothetical protein